MGRRAEIGLMVKIINLIKKKGTIHNFDLRDQLSISKSQYNSIKPDLERQFGWEVRYNKQTKCWEKIDKEEFEDAE